MEENNAPDAQNAPETNDAQSAADLQGAAGQQDAADLQGVAGGAAVKIKWRLNLFDVVFIACALLAAAAIVIYLNRSGASVAIVSPGVQQTITYRLELREMLPGAAAAIKPGDELIDKIEVRPMGTVVDVRLEPSTRSSKNSVTGERVIVDYPGRVSAFVTVRATATVTEDEISVGGYLVRAGVTANVNGPLYNGAGYIIDVERGDD
jgi:hypothetical protein